MYFFDTKKKLEYFWLFSASLNVLPVLQQVVFYRKVATNAENCSKYQCTQRI